MSCAKLTKHEPPGGGQQPLPGAAAGLEERTTEISVGDQAALQAILRASRADFQAALSRVIDEIRRRSRPVARRRRPNGKDA